ncbi:PAS domain S-box protein [Halomicrobium salinisoli]|uniref:PAS domain S-box protein n=1 Tax=Halomicrobium salinisoli TaxID=2878391 RepID=UPI001CF0715A|nr:PAS domain S-box protein [Halomicrobium salinisoli]
MESSSESALRAEIRRREVVADLAQRALETGDLGRLLDDAAATVADALDAEYGAAFELSPDRGEGVLRSGAGWEDGVVGTAAVPVDGDSLVGRVLDAGEPVVVDDLTADGRVRGAALFADRGVASGVSAPVGPTDEPWGVVGAYATDQRAFAAADAALLDDVADVLGSAVERARVRGEPTDVYGRVSDAVVAVDAEWRVTYLDEAARDLFGVEGRAVGRPAGDAMPDGVRERLGPDCERALETGETVAFEAYLPDPLDGWFAVRAYPSGTGLSVFLRELTDRERPRRRLAEERDMFAEGPAVVFRWRNEEGWPVEYVSENVEDVLGYAPAELESGDVPYTDLLLDAERDRIAAEVAEHSDGTTERFSHEPYRVRTKEGEIRWVKDTTKVVRDEAGEITHYLGYLVDITERKVRERELEESERRYRTLIDHFPNGAVALVDEDLRYRTVGGEPERIAGDTADEIEGRPVAEAVSPELAAELVPRYEAALEGDADSFEAELGGRHYRFRIVPVRDGDGEAFAALGTSQDVTERTEHERMLAKYETIFETVDDGIYVKDEDGRFTMVNEAYAEMTGYDRDELLGEHASMVVDESTIEQSRAAMTDEDGTRAVTAEIETADGDRVPAEATFATLETREGGREEIGVVRDVTEREERERQLEALVDELEESNERLEQFAYAASHDLQEPLRMVSSYLQLIESRYAEELDEDGREFIEFAVDGADRMRDMIEGLLEYSRVETRGEPFELVDLDDVLDDVRRDLQMRIAESGAEITAADLPRVEGDRDQLRQVFQNLLDNAIEYAGEDPPRIRIDAERRADRWQVSVSDEGVGIDPDDADRVFEVFERLHGREEHAGTGIGLALVERIVERHGGDVQVESEPGEGSTFTFTLPAADGGR